MVLKELGVLGVLLLISCVHNEARGVGNIRSDSIETYYPAPASSKGVYDENSSPTIEDNPKKPGWMVRTYRKLFTKHRNANVDKPRTQLMRFGDITSRVSNHIGGTAMKVTAIIEKLCKMLKTVIPIVAAVCNVGQFQFCMSADAPVQLAEAMNTPMNTMDLNSPDK